MWSFVEEVERFQDVACKYQVRVRLQNGATQRTAFLKFCTNPTTEQVSTAAANLCAKLITAEDEANAQDAAYAAARYKFRCPDCQMDFADEVMVERIQQDAINEQGH